MPDITPELRERLLNTNVLKVKQCVVRAQLEGYGVTEHALRQWIKSGAIPTRQIGTSRTNLIFYPNLRRFLECVDGADNQQPASIATGSGIRRL